MRAVQGLGFLVAAALTAWTFLQPAAGGWAFAAMDFLFLAWLAREMRRVDRGALLARPREPLQADEAELIGRYSFYFAYPNLSRECASTLASIGLATLVLVPWLIYKLQWPQAIVIGVMMFAVGRMTKLLSPIYALRLATAKGDRDALRLLSAHDGARRKLSAPEEPGA